MRLDRRLLASVGLVVLSLLGLGLEARPPAWIDADPLLQPFGQGPPPRAASESARKDRERTPVPVLLGRATSDDLVALPGIGPKTAARILAWRDTVGVVTALERLLEVRGIGPKKLEGLRPWVLFAAPTDSLDAAAVDSLP